MQILHILDTHGLHDRIGELPAADVLVHSGDFTMMGTKDFMNWLSELRWFKHIVFIAGNHDICMYRAERVAGLAENVHFLQHSSIEIDGIKFYGLPLYVRDIRANRYDLLIDAIPTDVDVLVTHQPPYGFLDVTDYGNGFCVN